MGWLLEIEVLHRVWLWGRFILGIWEWVPWKIVLSSVNFSTVFLIAYQEDTGEVNFQFGLRIQPPRGCPRKKKSPLRAATWAQLAPQPVSGAPVLQDLQLWAREQANYWDIFVKKHFGILLFSIFTKTKMKITRTLHETVTCTVLDLVGFWRRYFNILKLRWWKSSSHTYEYNTKDSKAPFPTDHDDHLSLN